MHWFGETWGAPICDPDDRVGTPVGDRCLLCDEEIEPLDQGVITPFVNEHGRAKLVPEHLDCFLDTVLPHGPDCERCRGLERSQHKLSCGYAKHGGECDCPYGARVRKLLDPSLTMAEAGNIAGFLGLDLSEVLAMAKRRRRGAHKRKHEAAGGRAAKGDADEPR